MISQIWKKYWKPFCNNMRDAMAIACDAPIPDYNNKASNNNRPRTVKATHDFEILSVKVYFIRIGNRVEKFVKD